MVNLGNTVYDSVPLYQSELIYIIKINNTIFVWMNTYPFRPVFE